MRIVVLIALLILPASIVFAEVQTDPFGFREEDYSSWGITDAPYPFTGVDADGTEIGYGCFPMGNGFVFAHLGVDGDFNTLRGITGSGYQTRDDDGKAVWWQEGDWPDLDIQILCREGYPANLKAGYEAIISTMEPLVPTQQSITAVRGAAMVRTIQRTSQGTLYCLTYAVPGLSLVIREYVLESSLYRPMLVGLLENPLAEATTEGALIYKSKMVLTVVGNPALTNDGSYAAFGSYGDGGAWLHLAITTGSTCDKPLEISLDRESIEEYRQLTRDYWQAWSSQNLSFSTGDPRLDDMMIQLPVIIETQRDAYSGGVAPMVSYHGYWVRDSMGPMLMYMANRRFDEVMRMLRYHRAASLHYGHCHMQVPLDLDLSSLPGWAPGEPGTAGDLSAIGIRVEGWEGVGVEHAEVPSLIVLQHYLLWREMHSAGYGADADAFITEAWPFIAHNLFSMDFDPTYGVKFHGDETYAHGALYSTYDRAESGQIGYPNGYIPTDFFSFDNTILHRAAAAAVEELGVRLGDIVSAEKANDLKEQLDAIISQQYYAAGHNWSLPYACAISPLTEQRWVLPFSNILLRPYWLGLDYGVLDDLDTSLSHMQHVLELWHSPYPRTTPWSSYMTGHCLGYWLEATRSWGSQHQVHSAVQLLLQSASPEGAWCEVLDPAGMPVNIYGRINRIRPWESGVNYFSLADYCLYQCLYHEHQAYFSGKISGGYLQSFNARLWVPRDTQLLVITKSEDWLKRAQLDSRLATLDEVQVTAWDAGLPFSVANLEALFTHQDFSDSWNYGARTGIAIPYLFFDTGVRGGLDRRTFKDEEFWFGEEMTQLLADYEAAGGTVIDADAGAAGLSKDE